MEKISIKKSFLTGIENLHPAYFSFVMATGIVSIACHLLQMDWIAFLLFYFNILAYLVLWLLTLLRLFLYPQRMLKDLMIHALGPGYFTLVAGTCVLGAEFVNLTQNYSVAIFLWVLGVFLWEIIMYAFFTAVIVRTQETQPGTGHQWRLVDRYGGHTICFNLGNIGRISVSKLYAGYFVHYLDVLLVGLHALPEHNRLDFLPSHFHRTETGRIDPPILDQYGGCSDHNSGGRYAYAQQQSVEFFESNYYPL